MSQPPPQNQPTLNFLSLNPSAPTTETILLLHTAFSSHRDFATATPHLAHHHHLLLPDLPAHGRSTSHAIPFAPTDTIALLADLIAHEAHDGKAHVVGVSLGGILGLYLASRYPDRVKSVFVSGCGRDLRGSWSARYIGAFMAIGFPTLVLSVCWLPRGVFEWLYGYLGLVVPEGLQEDQRAAAGYGIGFTLARAFLSGEFGAELLGKVGAKTLLVAAERDDDVEGTRWMGGELRKGNSGSRAVKVQGMRHVWCLQDGELFARGVEAWLGEGRVLEEFEVL